MISPRLIHFLSRSLVVLACLLGRLHAATFDGSSRVEVGDPSSALSFDSQNDSLSVACWFKLTAPTDKTLTENMTILVNRRGGSESDIHSYLIQFNRETGNIEFSARGDVGRFVACSGYREPVRAGCEPVSACAHFLFAKHRWSCQACRS